MKDGPRPGDWLLGKWRLDRLLGTGGMSSVFSATHRNGSRVAIKVLAPHLLGSPKAQRRFLREGYIANRVEHPGAVRVLDDGQDGNHTFLVMELLQGASLEALRKARGGALSPAESVWVTRSVLSVLQAAHSANIVHRDVKPQNLFLTQSGELKLLDFGVASLRGIPGFTTLTDSAGQPGTPGFMAPEQVRGRQEEVGPHTDLWGLGATLFRLLTGQTVHDAPTAGEMMVATATRAPRSVAEGCPNLAPRMVAVVDKALRLVPTDRWRTATEMLAALDEASAELPQLVAPTLPVECLQEEVTWDTDFEAGSGERLPDVDEVPLAREIRKKPRARALWSAGFALCAIGVAAAGVHYATRARLEAPEQSTEAPILGHGATRDAEQGNGSMGDVPPTDTALGLASPGGEPLPSVVAERSRAAPTASINAPTMPPPTRPRKRETSPVGTVPKSERDLLQRRL